MASFNKVVLMGNITRQPELRNIPGSNTAVARTGIAVNRRYKDKDETMFVDIVAFGRQAEIMGEYVTKGTPLLIDGRLSMNTWEQEGQRRTKHEIIVESFQMVGRKEDNYSNNSYNSDSTVSESNFKQTDSIDEDDVPF